MLYTKLRSVILASAFLAGCGSSEGDPDGAASASVSGVPTGSAPGGAATPGAPTTNTPSVTGPGPAVVPTPSGGGGPGVTANPTTVPMPGVTTGPGQMGTGPAIPSGTGAPATTPGPGQTGVVPSGTPSESPTVSGTGGAPDAMPAGTGGATDPGPAADPTPPNLVVTSADNDFWKVGEWTEASSGSPNVTVNDGQTAQKWDGFGGAFNELGWDVLTTQALQDEAIKLLFDAADGANITWGRIPIGASDYARDRYTLDDTGDDVEAQSGEGNRPPADTELTKFSLARDEMTLIPYIKAAQAVKSDMHFWASPWTPPTWMKTGYKTDSGGTGGGDAKRPSYFDGGNMKSDDAILEAYAQYYKKFVTGYKDKGIDIEIVSPQNEPGYDQNYPSCLWDSATYIKFVGQHLGPTMKDIGVSIMLGTMSNAGDNNKSDLDLATAIAGDATAKSFFTVAGAQWGVLAKVNEGSSLGGLPIWATEHKCGNYPWNPSGYPMYNMTQAPNDMAYGVESWGYIKDAINKGKVTSYSAWNMVLDKNGLGNDLSRDWRQNALLVSDGGMIKPTPYYYVFRHVAQYVTPGATVVSAGNDAIGFKNPNGSIVAIIYNSGSANPNYVVSIGGKNVTFAMPGAGWATVKVTP